MRLYLFIFALLSGVFPVSAQTPGLPSTKAGQKPNIIFVFTDDLGYGDLGVFFQNLRRTRNARSEPWTLSPNLDQLAAEGALITHHYCPAPVCAPSRASLLLGKSQGHANVRDNQFDKALEDNHTIASTLKRIGYTTVAIGKWGLQGLNHEGPDWPAHPLNRGFDDYFGYMRHTDGHEHYPKEGVYKGVKQVWDNRTNITNLLDKCYTPDLWTAKAKDWIINFKDTRPAKPFFMYLSYETPHAVLELPTQPYPPGAGMKGGMQWLNKPGQMINTASGKVDSWVHPDYVNATYDHDNNPSSAEVAWPDVYKRYATSIRRIDDAVNDIKRLLSDLRIAENTLIVFTSDNGASNESYLKESFKPGFFNSFGPFDGIKRDCWEGGVRVPAIAVWPARIPANTEVSHPGVLYDWLPTLTEAAGMPAPASADGVSLLPSLTRTGRQISKPVYIEYFQNQQTPPYEEFDPSHRNRKRNQMQLIRFGDTLGVRYDIKSHADDFEIYNIVKDPQEIQNLAGKPGMSQVQAMMKDKVLQLRMPDKEAPRPYDKEFIPAVKRLHARPGIRWKFYPGVFPWVPDVASLQPSLTGSLKLPSEKFKGRARKGLLYIEGYINAAADDEYTFYLDADKSAYLRVHDVSVIDADFGYQPSRERQATIKLKAGLHPFRLYYTIKSRKKNTGLALKWSGTKMVKQPITADAFCYE